ncbi:MAG: DegV family protein [Solirubrobacterales bacterium]|nr:DegV family protein [Solirubrobacterales bacterium]MCB1008491.1 DegV family protein [Acidobacteriota bacterium]MCB8969319.1 DegV family protein [Thermoleophilales bacterium]MCO5328089.1 DegV family protein [Solirubrobacterales bacterium]
MSPAERTAIVCDTTAYLPDELIAAHGIERISLYVSLAGEQRPEIDMGDYATFFERLRASDEGATTSQPSVGDFVAIYAPLLEAGREIVSIHLSAGISGTYESALTARQQLVDEGEGGERIHVIDSRTACGGMGLLALAASEAAERGESGEEIVSRLAGAREGLSMWFAIDTLEYLRRGGRIGAARAWLGSALQIKPILTLEEEITPVERVRTRRRVFERLVKYAEELKEAGRDAWVVQHIQDPENAQRLVERCREVMGSDPVFVSEIGPVIGAHTGPGLLGVGGLPSEYMR